MKARIFGGKRYTLQSWERDKTDANEKVRQWREDGYAAQMLYSKSQKKWGVYVKRTKRVKK